MNFGEALTELKAGSRLQRTGWNGRGMFVLAEVVRMCGDDTMCLLMKTAQNTAVPWTISQTDALAEDWVVVSDNKGPVA